jgi:hypothetical protein
MFKAIHPSFGVATRADEHVHLDEEGELDPIPSFLKSLNPDLRTLIIEIPVFVQCVINGDFTGVDALHCLIACLHRSGELSALLHEFPDLHNPALFLMFSVFLNGLSANPTAPRTLLGIIDQLWRAGRAHQRTLFPEPLIDAVIAYFAHADLTLASLAFSSIANLAATSPESAALLLTKDIAPAILAYFSHFPAPHWRADRALRMIAILSKSANPDNWAPFCPLLPFVLPYVNAGLGPRHCALSATVIWRSIALIEGHQWILDGGVVDALVAANQQFQLGSLYDAYDALIERGWGSLLDRDDWYDTLYRLIGEMADQVAAGTFCRACGVIGRMAGSHGKEIYEHGIAGALIAVTECGRPERRRAAAICLGHMICVLPMAISAELAEKGALAALCDVVAQERFPGAEAALHAIQALVIEDDRWSAVARDAGLCLTPCEGDQEDERLHELMEEVMAVVFPG